MNNRTTSQLAYSALSLSQDPAAPMPLIDQDETLKMSDHVYIILDDNVGFVPNVGIVVGERATLVIDPGLGASAFPDSAQMMRSFPGFRSPNYGAPAWRESLAHLAGLDVDVVVPSHGPTGDASMIQVYDDFFATIQSRVAELRAQGHSADEVSELLVAELGPRYSDWLAEDADLIGNVARSVYEETP